MGLDSGWYMASTSTIAPRYNETMGQIGTVNAKTWGISRTRLDAGVPWCLDNGMFTGQFELNLWVDTLKKYGEYKSTCLFIAIPDVVGNFAATLAQFHHYRSMVTDFPVALVSQDGINNYVNQIPWNDFDCLFVGGSDYHKQGKEGGWIISEAKKRNKWVHIGRVNSVGRILKFWRADSWDGTHLGFMPSDVTKFHAAVLQVRNMKQSKGMFDDLHHNVFGGNCISESV